MCKSFTEFYNTFSFYFREVTIALEDNIEWETLYFLGLFNGASSIHPELNPRYASYFFNPQYFWRRYAQFSGDFKREYTALYTAWEHFFSTIESRVHKEFEALVNTNWLEIAFKDYIAGFKGWAQQSPLRLATFLYAVIFSYVRYRLPLTFREFLGLKIAKRVLRVTTFSLPFLLPLRVKKLSVTELRQFFKVLYPVYYTQYIYVFFKTTLVALLGGLFFFYYSMLYFSFSFLKQTVI